MLVSRKIKSDVKYRDLGGKTIQIEREVPVRDLMELASRGNWAVYNFIDRRPDIHWDYPLKIYYGHVGNLGYVVAEDELEETK